MERFLDPLHFKSTCFLILMMRGVLLRRGARFCSTERSLLVSFVGHEWPISNQRHQIIRNKLHSKYSIESVYTNDQDTEDSELALCTRQPMTAFDPKKADVVIVGREEDMSMDTSFLVKASLDAGKHVLLEKPCFVDPSLHEQARSNNLVLKAGYYKRHDDEFNIAKAHLWASNSDVHDIQLLLREPRQRLDNESTQHMVEQFMSAEIDYLVWMLDPIDTARVVGVDENETGVRAKMEFEAQGKSMTASITYSWDHFNYLTKMLWNDRAMTRYEALSWPSAPWVDVHAEAIVEEMQLFHRMCVDPSSEEHADMLEETRTHAVVRQLVEEINAWTDRGVLAAAPVAPSLEEHTEEMREKLRDDGLLRE